MTTPSVAGRLCSRPNPLARVPGEDSRARRRCLRRAAGRVVPVRSASPGHAGGRSPPGPGPCLASSLAASSAAVCSRSEPVLRVAGPALTAGPERDGLSHDRLGASGSGSGSCNWCSCCLTNSDHQPATRDGRSHPSVVGDPADAVARLAGAAEASRLVGLGHRCGDGHRFLVVPRERPPLDAVVRLVDAAGMRPA